jgi:hypothetical protein
MKVAILNNDNSFSHIEEAQLVKTFDVDGKTLIDTYSIGGIFVDILPKIDYNPEIEKLVFNFEDNRWIKQDIEISGDFYLKTNGSHHVSITKKQSDLYTEIAPVINDGDSVIFDDDNQAWGYTIKGDITLEKELALYKENLIKECVTFYESLRQFKVIAGKLSLPIFANEAMSQNINTWIDTIDYNISTNALSSDSQAHYEYFINNSNGETVSVKVPYKTCVKIKQTIAKVRTEVVKVRDYHVGNAFGVIGEINKIQTIEQLKTYDYKINANKELVKPFDPVTL